MHWIALKMTLQLPWRPPEPGAPRRTVSVAARSSAEDRRLCCLVSHSRHAGSMHHLL